MHLVTSVCMSKANRICVSMAVACLLVVSTVARASTFTDGFQDNNRLFSPATSTNGNTTIGTGTVTDASDTGFNWYAQPGNGAQYLPGTVAKLHVQTNTMFGGATNNALSVKSGTGAALPWFSFVGVFASSPQTLLTGANTSATLSFDMIWTNALTTADTGAAPPAYYGLALTSNSTAVRFSLLNSVLGGTDYPVTADVADGGTANSSAGSGYFGAFGLGSPAANATLMGYEAGFAPAVHNTGPVGQRTADTVTGTAFSMNNHDVYNVAYTIKELSASSAQLTMVITDKSNGARGPWTFTATDSKTVITSFDEFGITLLPGTDGAELSFDIDNVTITPEPATMALLGIGAVGMMSRRRK